MGKMALALSIAISILLLSMPSRAALDHPQNFPHIKAFIVDYMGLGWSSPAENTTTGPAIKDFIANHYDAVVGGGRNLTPYNPSPPPQLLYTNYYCTYVEFDEYMDAKGWAENHSVDFESFFIHYAEPTRACYGTECYDLPAGSRVPSYGWYNTSGNLTKRGARVIYNPGNPNYRQWKLDYLDRLFRSNSNYDGVMIDNTNLNSVGTSTPAVQSGGNYSEYPNPNAAMSYGNDLLAMFREFKQKFGSSKAQVPNVANYRDSYTRINLTYECTDPDCPYVWGLVREFSIRADSGVWVGADIASDIQRSENRGVKNLMGGLVTAKRYDIPFLALYYLFQTDSTLIFPFLRYAGDNYGIDPRVNQWIPAIEYDIGQPANDTSAAQKYAALHTAIDPTSPMKDIMQVTNVSKTTYTYRLTDAGKDWTTDQWQNKKIVFPSGFSMNVYHSGADWVDIYSPKEIPALGEYGLGNFTYTVYEREYQKALVVYKSYFYASTTGDNTSTAEPLPATADNPSGRYYILDSNGTLNQTPVTSVQLRNSDGLILIKESALSCPVKADSRPCDGCVDGTELGMFINRWYVDSSNPNLKDLMEAIGLWKRGC